MKNDKFKFYIPADLVKATDEKGQEVMKFNGIASSPDLDSQQEYLDPSGFDLSAFKFVNWNHLGTKEPGKIIGEPTKYEITKSNELYVEGILFPEVKSAVETWDLMRALKNSPSGNKLGISVEGKVLAKDPKNPKRITKARITAIALCPVPINGATWADVVKGEMPEDDEEIMDDETKKAMTAQEADGVTQKESVEHCKKDMKKSDVFEQIFLMYPELEIEKSQSIYQLITKIATMTSKEIKITPEVLQKAHEILGLASDDISKAAAEKEEPKAEEKKEVEKSDDKDVDDKDQKEMVEKAKSKKAVMKAAGKTDEEVKKSLETTFSAAIVEKALSIETPVISGLSKGEVEDIIKSSTSDLATKFDAVVTVLKQQIAQNVDLQKSIDAIKTENGGLKGEIEKIAKTPIPQKSTNITKSYTEKFVTDDNGATKPVYNLSNKLEVKSLVAKIHEISGLNKGDGKYDNELVQIAQELETMGGLYKSESVERLQACGFELTK